MTFHINVLLIFYYTHTRNRKTKANVTTISLLRSQTHFSRSFKFCYPSYDTAIWRHQVSDSLVSSSTETNKLLEITPFLCRTTICWSQVSGPGERINVDTGDWTLAHAGRCTYSDGKNLDLSKCIFVSTCFLHSVWHLRVSPYTSPHHVLGTVQNALCFTLWQTCSNEHHLDFSGSIQPRCNWYTKNFRTQLSSTLRYSFVQVEQCGVSWPIFNTTSLNHSAPSLTYSVLYS